MSFGSFGPLIDDEAGSSRLGSRANFWFVAYRTYILFPCISFTEKHSQEQLMTLEDCYN